MIDYKTYRIFHPSAEAFHFSQSSLAPFDRWPEKIPHNATLDDDLIILLPPFIHGFFLKDKRWGKYFPIIRFILKTKNLMLTFCDSNITC
jgi:hypothetical protein